LKVGGRDERLRGLGVKDLKRREDRSSLSFCTYVQRRTLKVGGRGERLRGLGVEELREKRTGAVEALSLYVNADNDG
jgi:hypothetical protein